MTQNNRNSLSYRFRDQKPEIKVVGRAKLPLKLPQESPSFLFQLWWLLAFLVNGSITPVSASVFTWPSSLCVCSLPPFSYQDGSLGV